MMLAHRTARALFLSILAALVAALSPAIARAQQRAPVWGFFNARYDTRTSNFIYAGYGYGRAFAFVGVLANPRSGYTEVLGGLGSTFQLGRVSSHLAGLAAAKASDAWYAQLYYLPTVRLGPTTTRATLEWYFPLEDAGIPQFGVSPMSITVPMGSRLEAGAAMELATAQEQDTGIGIGPELRFTIPRATIGIDAFQDVAGGDGRRFRAFFNASF